MRRLFLLLIGFALAAGLSSCEENITLDLPEYEPKLAVFCVLHPGETPELYLNRSKSYFDYSDTSHEIVYISDAQVIITDVTAGINDTLKFYEVSPDFKKDNIYLGKIKPVAGQRYILNVWHNGKHVTAETIVPKAVEITGIENRLDSSMFGNYYGSIILKYRDIAGEENAYSLTTLIPNGWSGDTTNQYVQSDNSYNYDRNSDGQEMQNEYYNSFYNGGGLDSMVVYFQIENHTKATAEYLESVRDQRYASGDPTSEPVIIKHNITGGLGIFGASTLSKKVRFRVW